MSILSTARVLVVGVGGLGCPASIVLARAGVGTIGLVDDDLVDVTNLHRQILYREEDVGVSKTLAASRALTALAPQVRIEAHETRFLPMNAVDLASRYDLVVECSDNFSTKFLAADAAHGAHRPVVHAAAVRWYGTALAVGSAGKPCYRCLFEDIPSDQVNSAEAGVIGPMVGVVAAAQADLALSALLGKDVFGALFTFDAKTLFVRRRRIEPRSRCALCGARA
ncbi:MAG: HesA/MoeB/ThiF family protein [Polyangiaceae bacterium]|nr:HesA/MoeB/ThiF family protein [Polyangiaceae bacterium]